MPTWLWVVGGLIAFFVLLGLFGSHAAIAAGRVARVVVPPKPFVPPPDVPEPPEVREARLRYRAAKRQVRKLKEQERKAKQAFDN